MSDTRHDICELIERYADGTGRAETTVSRLAGGSGGLYDRLLAGHDITTRRAARIRQWMSDHWPSGLPWPAGVERPPPTDPPDTPPAPASLKRTSNGGRPSGRREPPPARGASAVLASRYRELTGLAAPVPGVGAAWYAARWPEGADWPEGVERPGGAGEAA